MISYASKFLLCLILIRFARAECADDEYEGEFDYKVFNSEEHTVIDDEEHHAELHRFSTTGVKLYLYTPPPKNETIEITQENMNLLNSSKPTKIIIHGEKGFDNQVWIDNMVQNYHVKGDYNVVAVDWSKWTTSDTFYTATAVNEVGKVVGEFIIEITKENFVLLSDLHLIGSSLGAQIGGAAAKKVLKITDGKVDRITGLDPNDLDVEALDKEDAEFVDVYHTNFFSGVSNRGTADFYVTSDDPHTLKCVNDSCEGTPANEVFTLTIVDSDRYLAIACDNATAYAQKLCTNNTKVPVGENVPRNISGSYFVTTDSASRLFGDQYILTLFVGILFFLLSK